MKLRILNNLVEIKENDGVAISAILSCECGHRRFRFFHTGKQTKGVLAPYIIKKNGQLRLVAQCACCGKNIEVYNSSVDGSSLKNDRQVTEFLPFITPKTAEDKFEIAIKYNYLVKQFKENGEYSNQFEDCFIYIIKNGKEGKALIEE